MVRKLALVVVVAAAAAAVGETVYLRDGRKLVGSVTRADGKVTIEMAHGTISVAEADVIYISKSSAAPRSRPAGSFEQRPDFEVPAATIQPTVVWDPAAVTLPEPALFITARKIDALAGLDEDLTHLTRQLGQWRARTHDGLRKVGPEWLSRKKQRFRRDTFLKGLKEGEALARKARYVRGTTKAHEQQKKQLQARADAALVKAARAWPDGVLRDFLTAVMDLESGRHGLAEARFRRCAEREPLLAAYHQGRGLALLAKDRPMQALEAFVACLQLRDDTYDSLDLLRQGMKAVPGHELKQPIFIRAKEMVERYQKPKSKPRRYSSETKWLLPGKIKVKRGQVLFAPPYDRLVAKQALAVPVGAKGLLAVDRGAVEGAELMYVQIAKGALFRAWPVRAGYGRRSGPDLPLATIVVPNVDFTPVDLTKPAALAADQDVTTRSVNLYRQMGTRVRLGQARVGPGGKAVIPALLAGEPVGAVFAGDAFAGFLTGRCDHEKKDFGVSRLIAADDLAAWAKTALRSSRYSSSYSKRPVLKEDATRPSADGQAFLVHILVGEEPPTSLGK